MTAQSLTPLMQQYWQVKSQHPDKIVMFRMGDFFEMFYEDAEKSAPILNIVLTRRNKKSAKEVKMCGLPHHSLAGAVSKLLSAGLKVAVCDQVEPADQAKGLVKREVTRILSPGMVYSPESLDKMQANYLCALDEDSVSFADFSTGRAFFYLTQDTSSKKDLIHLLRPVELVLSPEQKEQYFSDKEWKEYHQTVFDFSLDKKNFLANKKQPLSVLRLLAYIKTQQNVTALKTLPVFERKILGKQIRLSKEVVGHLELFQSYQGDKKHSLFYAVNRTCTSPGARLLRQQITTPSCDKEEINGRLNAVEKWVQNPDLLKKVRSLLSQTGDIERQLGKITQAGFNSQDLLAAASSLKTGAEALSLRGNAFPQVLESAKKIAEEIFSIIKPCSSSAGFIKKTVSPELDALTADREQQEMFLKKLEDKERKQTGISSLKIRSNSVFGYYIEVTKVHFKKVPPHYIRRQTLTQAERYTTKDLQTLEEKIFSAEARKREMELKIFSDLKNKVIQMFPELLHSAKILSSIDVSASWAHLALERNYTRPQFSKDRQFILMNSRHPVVEQKQGQGFVPNTVRLKAGECLLLTGPNMAGKSTLLRQSALIALMAQAGGFVPAEQALLPLFTQIFTRIGASDKLSEGLSTFMVEMKESANILKMADENSLILLDEIGRGTATYDGMSLAEAILEYIVTETKSLVFFATHYHELTALSQKFSQVRNAHISVQEKDGAVDFLYTLSPGPSQQSYGIHAARLAGFPSSVLARAWELLKQKEAQAPVQKPAGNKEYSPCLEKRNRKIIEI